jgi:hypothetical protein
MEGLVFMLAWHKIKATPEISPDGHYVLLIDDKLYRHTRCSSEAISGSLTLLNIWERVSVTGNSVLRREHGLSKTVF